MGERAVRFAPGRRDDYVDVCPLCQETAVEHGWVKEGSPTTPDRSPTRRRRRRSASRRSSARPREPAASRSSPSRSCAASPSPSSAMVEAADLFNESDVPPHGRRDREEPRRAAGVSIVPLSGVNPEVVITVAWDISWYQYRVSPDSAQPVRLAERGHELGRARAAVHGLERAARAGDGRVVPEIAPALARARAVPTIREQDDLLRDPARARGRALREDGRVLQGQPERDVIVDRRDGARPAQGPAPPAASARSATAAGPRGRARSRAPTPPD